MTKCEGCQKEINDIEGQDRNAINIIYVGKGKYLKICNECFIKWRNVN